jgi:hypothetical protein
VKSKPCEKHAGTQVPKNSIGQKRPPSRNSRGKEAGRECALTIPWKDNGKTGLGPRNEERG